MIHKPRTFLSDAECSATLVGTYSVLAIHNEPHRYEPLVQSDRTVLENRAVLNRKLPFRMLALAFPAAHALVISNIAAVARWTSDAIRPAARFNKFNAVFMVREVDNGFL